MRRFGTAVVLPAALAAVLGTMMADGGSAPAAGAALTAPADSPSAAGPAGRGAALLPPGHTWRVTLVTGDVVGVRTVSGRPPMVTVRPGRGRQGTIFSKFVDTHGHVEVVPHDVAPLAGRSWTRRCLM